MALFFDARWFDAKLAERGLSRADMAVAARVCVNDLTLMIKDQMEVTSDQIAAWAALLDQDIAETANRCGVSPPVQAIQSEAQRVTYLEARVATLEGQVLALIRQQDAKL